MFDCIELRDKSEYFNGCSLRAAKGVYFYRLAGYSAEIREFLWKYLEETKRCGVWLKEKIQNPTEQQLAYFEEIMGLDFKMETGFFEIALKKWLPRLSNDQRTSISGAMNHTMQELKSAGKNDNILKNGYIKFMCWFYYKFERILNQLGGEHIPKILYEGYVSSYELYVLHILAQAGCDVLLLEYEGDEPYLKTDPHSAHSRLMTAEGTGLFPQGFSISAMVQEEQEASQLPDVHIGEPQYPVSTNTWLSGDLLEDCLRQPKTRGVSGFYYNLFVRIRGVEEPANYENDLLRWKLKLEAQKRVMVLLETIISVPGVDEVNKIPRKNYKTPQQLILDLAGNIEFSRNKDLEILSRKAFVEVMTAEDQKQDTNLTRLLNRGICLLCWVKRFVPQLFPDWRADTAPVFLLYGVCSNENETVLMRFLAKLPVDVFEVCPDLTLHCRLEDKFLFDRVHEQSLPLGKFPTEAGNMGFRTAAYNAEQQLNTILYQDTGLYRNRQFQKAVPLPLQTTYEEIAILWDQEAKYRPNFETLPDRVMVPVICAKISGVPGGDAQKYWKAVAGLVVEDTAVVYKLPYITAADENPMKPHVTKFIKDGRLLFDKIKEHGAYQYGFIREEMQDYMLDKLQECIEKRLIEGTFERGVEFVILSTCLNLNKGFLRMIQRFDFTRRVPKLIMISADETRCSLEDSILVAYLSLLGFDIALFTPTGYQNVESNFTQPVLTEHQAGDYMYDLRVPNLKEVPKGAPRESLRDILFRRVK